MDSNIGMFFHYCPDTLISSLSCSLSGISPVAPARYGSFDLTCSGILASPKRGGADDWDDETDEEEEEEDWEDEDFDDEEDFEDDDEFDYEDDDEEEYWDDEEDIDLDDDDDI